MHRHVPRIPLSRATTRRGSWVALIVGLLVGLTLIGGLRGIETPPHATSLPASAESARAAEAIAALPGGDVSALLVVATRDDGTALSPADLAALTELGTQLPVTPDTAASPAIPSEDARAAMLSVPVVAVADFQGNREVVDQVRDVVRDHAPNLTGLDVQVTGGPAFGADVSASFDGADLRLLPPPSPSSRCCSSSPTGPRSCGSSRCSSSASPTRSQPGSSPCSPGSSS